LWHIFKSSTKLNEFIYINFYDHESTHNINIDIVVIPWKRTSYTKGNSVIAISKRLVQETIFKFMEGIHLMKSYALEIFVFYFKLNKKKFAFHYTNLKSYTEYRKLMN
jgi:hypothetical protein